MGNYHSTLKIINTSLLLFLFVFLSEYLQHRGVECYFNNERLISSVHMVIFCVLPSQMTTISEEVKPYVSSSLIMLCPFSSLSLRRLRQMLGTANIIRPVLCWPEESQNKDYNYNVNINTALENPVTIKGTCPLGIDKSGKNLLDGDGILVGIWGFCGLEWAKY